MSMLIVTSFKDEQRSSFDKMTLLYRRFLQFVAILPLDGKDYNSSISRIFLLFFLTTSIINWTNFVSWVSQGGIPTIDTLCEMVVVIGINLRYYMLLYRRKKFANLLNECRQIWQDLCDDDETQNAVRHFERKVRILLYCIFGSFTLTTFLYEIAAIGLTLQSAHGNGTHTKYLPFKWIAEGMEDAWPGYYINFLIETIVSINAGTISTCVDTAAPLLIMIGAGYFRALKLRLYRIYDKALDNENNNIADQELVQCVRLHQRILEYCSKIDDITQSLFFVQLMATTYNISLVMIKLVGTDPDRYKYLSVATLNLGQLLICQWAPDLLIDESQEIATTAYSISVPWMNRPIIKTLMIMNARAQQPVQMTAAGVVYLSLERFGEMLKGAFSFFTVIRSFTN